MVAPVVGRVSRGWLTVIKGRPTALPCVAGVRLRRSLLVPPHDFRIIVWTSTRRDLPSGGRDLPDARTPIGAAVIIGGFCLYIRETKERTQSHET